MTERRVSQQQIDDANADIVGVISRYVSLKKTGKNYSARCPFHDEKSPSFSVSPDKGIWCCFGCQAEKERAAGNDAVGFVMLHAGCNFRDAVESINGRIELSSADHAPLQKRIRGVECSLPGHAEDRERSASVIDLCQPVATHPYLLFNNTAPHGYCMTHKGNLMVEIINNIGETVNVAAIRYHSAGADIKYAAGNPSYGSTAVIDPVGDHDGRKIICQDYAQAWRIWWACRGQSRVLAALDAGNLSWMLANCKERFTHVGCDPLETEWYRNELGFEVVEMGLDGYSQAGKRIAA